MLLSKVIINKKIVCILVSMTLSFMVIVVRLLYLQVYCGNYFLLRSHKNFIRYETVESPRGSIRDVRGNLLATNRPVTVVYWQGTGNYTLSSEQLTLLRSIEAIAGVTLTTGELFDKIIVTERKNKRVPLITDIDFGLLSKLSEAITSQKNMVIDTHFKRFYPYNACGSHVVGYLGNIRLLANGQLGLEKIFDADLCGKQGSMRNVVNSVGQRISQIELEKAMIGNDVQTTIDIDVQMVCEKIFPNHQTGSLIVLNPADGSIVSLVSRPNFDPNIFLDPISMDTWQGLQHKNPFLNRAILLVVLSDGIV